MGRKQNNVIKKEAILLFEKNANSALNPKPVMK